MKTWALLSALLFTACNPSDEQIAKWVEKNPDKIISALMKYQRDQQAANMPKPELVKENSSELFKRTASPSAGNGAIEIAYFFDFNCGHCAKQSETIKNVLEKNKNVKIIYKNFPVLGPSSELAAKAALAAHQQNKYQEFYNELFKIREKNPDSLKKIAGKIGLDLKKWQADMESSEVASEIQHVMDLAAKMKINGTPFLAIAPDKVFPGRVDDLMGVLESTKQ
jgi:protein-disulfide isomerase